MLPPVRTADDAALLEVLAACLGAGVPLADALARIETSGTRAWQWVARLRPHVRLGSSVAATLLAAGVVDGPEHALLAQALTPSATERLLLALVSRRRRRELLRTAFQAALAGPFGLAALTVVLAPLPNLLGSGSYVWPVTRGVFTLGVLAALVFLGLPAALGSPSLGSRVLGVLARVPGLDRLAARHAEAELVTLAAPFVEGGEASREGLLAASTALAWSPLGARVAEAAGVQGGPPALARLAPHLSLVTNLAIVSGAASQKLSARLTERGEELATQLRARLRVTLRVAAYTLVVILSFEGLANLVSRGLPGMPLLPGATPTGEQKELEELLRELDPPAHPPPSN
jgi:hypothetical protein